MMKAYILQNVKYPEIVHTTVYMTSAQAYAAKFELEDKTGNTWRVIPSWIMPPEEGESE